MLRRTLVRAVLVGLLATTGASLVVASSGASGTRSENAVSPLASAQQPIFSSELAFHDQMRKLWEDHITWTRNVIISFDADLPDLNAALARLLQNQTDIGDAIKPYYGDAAGDQLTALLRQHILGAADVLAALKAEDQTSRHNDNPTALQSALQAWYANAHDIAVFLSSANPENWPLAEMDAMMRDHLDATTQEAVARHQGDWNADVRAYDAVHVQALAMADMLSSGIVAQFPKAFKP
jgi:hypothetical protein